MTYISANKEINNLCNRLLATRLWVIDRRGKHIMLKHVAKGANKIISVPCTPSDPNAFLHFKHKVYSYLRKFFLSCGMIIA